MATETITTNITTTRTMDGADNLYILRDGSVTTSTGAGVDISGSNNNLYIEGTVAAQGQGVDSDSNAVGTDITIAETGVIVKGGTSGGTALFMNGTDESVINHGLISGAFGVVFSTSSDGNLLINHGSIFGNDSDGYLNNNDNNVAINYGDISGDRYGVNFSASVNGRLDNFGTISGRTGGVEGGLNDDEINNAGLIDGDVDLNGGDDTYDGAGGWVIGTIFGGNDNDTLLGGNMSDVFEDGSGNDTVKGRGGDDTVIAGTGNDVYRGGSGTDTINYNSATNKIKVDLSTNALTGIDVNGDTISGFERFFGGGGDDSIKGDDGDNNLRGAGGKDRLIGRDGDDRLFGNGGKDFLSGEEGSDRMAGGSGQDTFHFDDGGGVDKIVDFEDDVDTIEIDNFGLSKNQVLALADQEGADVNIDFGGGDVLVILNATIAQLGNDIDIV